MRAFTLFTIVAVAAILHAGPAVRAQEDPSNEIGLIFGWAIADENMVGDDSGPGGNYIFGLRYGHLFSPSVGLSVDATHVRYLAEPGFSDVRELGARAAIDWYFAKTKNTRWFLSSGVGAADFDPEDASISGETRGFGSVELGQKILSSGGVPSLRWSIRMDQTVTGDQFGDEDFTNFKASIAASWGLGGKPADDDGDGVMNRRDKCPNTPKGATVDEKGCPKDSDGDGVFDGIDKCPDTPRGWPVDSRGCPKDTDGDGVQDGRDKCPDTPKGAMVDDEGCPEDSDGDGVFDGLDKCPDTPKGATVDDAGCPKDSDGDGVFDGLDRCAATPRGATVDASGCPKDSDGDGVLDGLDKCPDTPRGTKVDASGCPLPVEKPKAEPLFTPEKKTLVLEGVHFEFDSAKLTPDSLAILDKVAASLRDWPEVKVEVSGHTDSMGTDAYNAKLSQQRAESVITYLRSAGVAAGRMKPRGYGESDPIADNNTDAGRAKNRRVVLTRID